MNIRGHCPEIANLKRQDALKKVERRKKKRTIFFVKQQEPSFPSIKKSIWKHLKLLHRDSELKELYPRNLFITSYKRPKTLKELLCPSKLLKKIKKLSAKIRASSNVRRNARHVKGLTHLENLHKK